MRIKFFIQVLSVLMCMCLVMATFFWVRCSIEGRRVTSDNMAPTLKTDEKVLFDMTWYRTGKPFQRGQIILFFPPNVKIDNRDISRDPMNALDRAFAPPSLHSPETSIKRVIGLPGDTVEVKAGGDVIVNGTKLNEPYVHDPARYELHALSDMGGQLLTGGSFYPYAGESGAIVVPPGQLFVLGDKRNHSQDSHMFGFLDQSRVLGKAILILYPRLEVIPNISQ